MVSLAILTEYAGKPVHRFYVPKTALAANSDKKVDGQSLAGLMTKFG